MTEDHCLIFAVSSLKEMCCRCAFGLCVGPVSSYIWSLAWPLLVWVIGICQPRLCIASTLHVHVAVPSSVLRITVSVIAFVLA